MIVTIPSGSLRVFYHRRGKNKTPVLGLGFFDGRHQPQIVICGGSALVELTLHIPHGT